MSTAAPTITASNDTFFIEMYRALRIDG
jgi:hypothetical protein